MRNPMTPSSYTVRDHITCVCIRIDFFFFIDSRISFWSCHSDQGLERRRIRWIGRVSVLSMLFQ